MVVCTNSTRIINLVSREEEGESEKGGCGINRVSAMPRFVRPHLRLHCPGITTQSCVFITSYRPNLIQEYENHEISFILSRFSNMQTIYSDQEGRHSRLHISMLTIPKGKTIRGFESFINSICQLEHLLEGTPVPRHFLYDIALDTSK